MNIEAKLKELKIYSGAYRGVGFEINNWQSKGIHDEMRDQWTYYIIIQLGKIPVENNPESFWLVPRRSDNNRHVFYDYHKHPVLNEMFFHGGITWYSKESNEDQLPEQRVIKIGCDFQHYRDEGMRYSLDFVLSEVKRTIDEFKTAIPNYKYWCSTVGGFWDKSEGELAENENDFKSFKGIEWENNRKSITA